MPRPIDADGFDPVRRWGALHVEAICGRPARLPELLRSLQRNGRDESILEAGLTLEQSEFDALTAAYRRTPVRRLPQVRRSR